MRQVMKALAVAFLLATLAPNTAHAQFFQPVEVLRAGPNSGGTVFIRLRHAASTPGFAVDWFRANALVANSMLATALTAIALDLKVQVNLDLINGEVLVIYLIK